MEEKFDKKEYDQRPDVKAKKRAYEHLPETKKRRKGYYQRVEVNERRNAYNQQHKEEQKVYQEGYRKNHKEETKTYKKTYDQEHKEELNIYFKGYAKMKRKTDVQYLTAYRLRNSLWKALDKYGDGKKLGASKYGIDWALCCKKLTKTKPEDFGKKKYEIDHIRPLCSFNLTDNEQVREAFKPENLRWLNEEENGIKAKEDKKQRLTRWKNEQSRT